jgi:hypothetical protein
VVLAWPLFKKGAGILFLIALLLGFGSTALAMGHHVSMDTWRVLFILSLIVLVITSTILIPGVLLPNVRSPHPEFLTEDLTDEWQDLQHHTIARPHLLMVAGAIAALVYAWCLLYYGKLTSAIWFGWFPVGVAAIGLALLLVAVARRTGWYNDRYYRTPNWVIFVAFGGFALAQFLGITMTEQHVAAPPGESISSQAATVDYGYVGSRAFYITRDYYNFGGPVPNVDMPDCDDDACGYVFLAILFVVLVTILVAGAALIPHMWVLSCLILLTLIALLVLHDVHRQRAMSY